MTRDYFRAMMLLFAVFLLSACWEIPVCPKGYHEGGGGLCIGDTDCPDEQKSEGLCCTVGYHNDGAGSCVADGSCREGYWLSASGSCVREGSCSVGFHDGGDGECVKEGSCSSGHHDAGDGACVKDEGGCPSGYVASSKSGLCCVDGYHDGGNKVCVPKGTCSAGYVLDDAGECGAGCVVPRDCPGEDDECQKRTCSEEGVCGIENTANNTLVSTQPTGNCKRVVCNGNGETRSEADDLNVPDGGECKTVICEGGEPSYFNKKEGTACSENGGYVCESGACKNKCYIAGQFYEPGDKDACRGECDPGEDRMNWTSPTAHDHDGPMTGQLTDDAFVAEVAVETLPNCLRRYRLGSNAPRREDQPPSPRTIDERTAQPRTRTGNPLFDALFALAIEEALENSVDAIRDGAFDNGAPLACPPGGCFETGANWHYVWSRDTAYAVDLGLAAFDPTRAKNSLLFKLSERRGGGDLQIVQVLAPDLRR